MKKLSFIFLLFIFTLVGAQNKNIEGKLFQEIDNTTFYKYYMKGNKLLIIDFDEKKEINGYYNYYGFADTCIVNIEELKLEGIFYFELSDRFVDEKTTDWECSQLAIKKNSEGKIELYHIISSMQQYTIFREVDIDTIPQPLMTFLTGRISNQD
jgi:hypothetical protein